MPLIDLYRQQSFVFSIEIFPPKTEDGMIRLKKKMKSYKEYNPDYISVTYGAGGGTRQNTHTMASYIKNELNIETMAHLTCVAHTPDEINDVVSELKKNNIINIMALRGDPPKGDTAFVPVAGGYHYANEMIEVLAQQGGLGLAAAGYPEGHSEAKSLDADRANLIQKINAGADFIITQFFLDNEVFLRWRDQLRSEGVTIPLIPGILCAQSDEHIKRLAAMGGCKIPKTLMQSFEPHHGNAVAMRDVGMDYAESQIQNLLKEGVEGVHLYGLNRLDVVHRLAPILSNT